MFFFAEDVVLSDPQGFAFCAMAGSDSNARWIRRTSVLAVE